jgi:hypothetical protein
MKLFTMSCVRTVYGIGSLSRKSRWESQPSPRPLPPMHGTLALITCFTPSGVVSENSPWEKAQMVSMSADFASFAW